VQYMYKLPEGGHSNPKRAANYSLHVLAALPTVCLL